MSTEEIRMSTQSYLKPVLAGAVGGALLTMLLGFTLGGWVTNSKSVSTARNQSNLAVIAALAPICFNNFKASADAQEQRALLIKTDDWKQPEFVNSAGWTKIPGVKRVSSGLARNCANLILASK
jgi:alpha/beta superfamily hydrolase